MKWVPLPIGVENFEDLRENEYYYVDKTLFIKELIDMRGKVNLFTRPRRFGKTLNMSMLRYFFDRENPDSDELFAGTKIMSAGEAYLKHKGKYPVISVTLKSMKQATYEDAFYCLKEEIATKYRRHDRIMSSLPYEADREKYLRIIERRAQPEEYLGALKFLAECIFQVYGEKSVILIDEYDVPLENAYFSGFYDRMVALIRSLFESALKTNDYLEFAVVTGCLRISKESIFTGLNNLKIMSITSKAYAEHFGFTPEDVEQMLRDYGLEENLETVKNLVEYADLSVKQEIETLIEGGTITKPVHEDITYDDMESTQDNLWNFLFFTGYLKKIREEQEGETIHMEMAIPNNEVRYIYKNAVLNWFKETTEKKELFPLYNSILDGDTEKMAEILSENLMETISFYDYQESYYHGFLAGMLKNIGNYSVWSNRESGNGRPDILLKYPSVRGKAVIIEIKVSKTYQGLEEKCDETLRQIEEQKYEETLRQEGYRDIMKYGVAFYRKECMVKMKRE